MSERTKWALSVLAVATFPIWILPFLVGAAFWHSVKTFKEMVIDRG